MYNNYDPEWAEQQQEKRRKKKWILIIILLIILALLATGCSVWAIWFRNPTLTPDYAPRAEDANAETIAGDTEDKLDRPEGGTAVGITYIPDVTIDLSDELATFTFQNPGRSTSDIILQIVIQDQILAQSGRLVPGKQLTSMELLNGAARMLSPGGYDGKFVVLFYDPDTAERAILKSEGAITVTVVE